MAVGTFIAVIRFLKKRCWSAPELHERIPPRPTVRVRDLQGLVTDVRGARGRDIDHAGMWQVLLELQYGQARLRWFTAAGGQGVFRLVRLVKDDDRVHAVRSGGPPGARPAPLAFVEPSGGPFGLGPVGSFDTLTFSNDL